MTDNLEALAQFIKSPCNLVSAEVALVFALPMQPSERSVTEGRIAGYRIGEDQSGGHDDQSKVPPADTA
jgi:hypothetical protein